MELAEWISRRVAALHRVESWKGSVSVTAPTHPGRAYVIDIDGQRVIAQFIVWPSGSMEATAGAVEDGQVFYLDSAQALEESELDERWQRFYSAILQVEAKEPFTGGGRNPA